MTYEAAQSSCIEVVGNVDSVGELESACYGSAPKLTWRRDAFCSSISCSRTSKFSS